MTREIKRRFDACVQKAITTHFYYAIVLVNLDQFKIISTIIFPLTQLIFFGTFTVFNKYRLLCLHWFYQLNNKMKKPIKCKIWNEKYTISSQKYSKLAEFAFQ